MLSILTVSSPFENNTKPKPINHPIPEYVMKSPEFFLMTIESRFTDMSIYFSTFKCITPEQPITLSCPVTESYLYTDIVVPPNATEVTYNSFFDTGMHDTILMFDFKKNLEADFGNIGWDLSMPSRTTSKDKNNDTESMSLFTNMIVAPLDIPMIFSIRILCQG